MDVSHTRGNLSFPRCEDKACINVSPDNGLAENYTLITVMLERSETLDRRIQISATVANVTVIDDDGKL